MKHLVVALAMTRAGNKTVTPSREQANAMKRRLPAAVNMIAELVFIVSVILIILGAVFDTFVSNPLLSILSVVAFCLSIFSWVYFQDT
jgi:hypothetical protein